MCEFSLYLPLCNSTIIYKHHFSLLLDSTREWSVSWMDESSYYFLGKYQQQYLMTACHRHCLERKKILRNNKQHKGKWNKTNNVVVELIWMHSRKANKEWTALNGSPLSLSPRQQQQMKTTKLEVEEVRLFIKRTDWRRLHAGVIKLQKVEVVELWCVRHLFVCSHHIRLPLTLPRLLSP